MGNPEVLVHGVSCQDRGEGPVKDRYEGDKHTEGAEKSEDNPSRWQVPVADGVFQKGPSVQP